MRTAAKWIIGLAVWPIGLWWVLRALGVPSWLQRVPGFRSNTGWKQLVALWGYFGVAWTLLSGSAPLAVAGVLMLAGLLLATNTWRIRDRVPPFNSPNSVRAGAGWAVLGILAMVSLILAVPPREQRSGDRGDASPAYADQASTLTIPGAVDTSTAAVPPSPMSRTATINERAREHYASALDYRTRQQYGLALTELDQALAIQAEYDDASSLRDLIQREASAAEYLHAGQLGLALAEMNQALALHPSDNTIQESWRQVSAQATAEIQRAEAAAAREAEARATATALGRRWEDFLRYGPQLGDYLVRSDQVNRTHAEAAGRVTIATVPAFYSLTNQAAQAQGNLKMAALGTRVPGEAREFSQSVYEALRQREDAMNRLKDALDSRRVSAQAAYQEAKQSVDRSTLRVVVELLSLCENLQATVDECFGAVRFTR